MKHKKISLEDKRKSYMNIVEENKSALRNVFGRIYLERSHIREVTDTFREIMSIPSLVDLLFTKENYLSLSIKKALGVY